MLLYVRSAYTEMHGIKVLLAAVLRRACFDIAMYKGSRDLRRRRMWEDAYDWMFGKQSDYTVDGFTSFTNICEVLDQDPNVIREKTLGLTRNDVRKFELVGTHARVH
jgi:hypothetical protein